MTSKMFAFVCFALLATGALGQIKEGSASSSSKEQIEIVSQTQDLSPDGTFSAAFEAANGIVFQETGELKNAGQADAEAQSIKGTASWTAPDGQQVKLSWTADENGAVFEGDHLPTPPPTQAIPEAIQRALDWAAKNPSKDYKEEKEN